MRMTDGAFSQMTNPAQAIAQRLAALGISSNFVTRFAIEADPQLHVRGVGDVPLPVTIHTAHRLCAVAQPAAHGYKDQTWPDPSDTAGSARAQYLEDPD
jgi:hypothetical protein